MADAEHKHDQHHVQQPSDSRKSPSMPDHSAHTVHNMQPHEVMKTNGEGHTEHAHHADHTGHEQMFRSRFWGSLLLSIPVLLFNSMIQEWLGFRIPSFVGSDWIPFIFALIIFAYGGIPFIQMAVPEIQ